MTTPNRSISSVTYDLMESIKSKDVKKTLGFINEFKTNLAKDIDYIAWITTPVNLTAVQSSLTESFGIPQKAMMIKPRAGSSRGLRATFFLQAMENSLKRVV